MIGAKSEDTLLRLRRCPSCGSDSYDIIMASGEVEHLTAAELSRLFSASSDKQLINNVVKCKKCKLVYVNPQFDENTILTCYENDADETFTSQDTERILTFKRILKRLSCLAPISPSQTPKVLDVGCAGGAFPKAADELGYKVIGVEVNQWLAEQGRKHYKLDIRGGTLQQQKFESEMFDLVTLWDVIEHLSSPDSIVKEIHRILNNEGWLIVNFPNYDSMARRILRRKWPMFLSVHLTYFSGLTMSSFLEQRGFAVQKIVPYWQSLKLGYVLNRADPYFPKLVGALRFIIPKPLIQSSIRYNIGQSCLLAKKRHVR